MAALERVPRTGADRFRVYLFSGEAGYQAWIKDVIGDIPPHTAGIYSPVSGAAAAPTSILMRSALLSPISRLKWRRM